MTNDDNISREGDVVLVRYQDKPAFYARIEAIEPDTIREWYQVTLLILLIPSQTVTWTLREEYINGVTFTMGGQPMRVEKVEPTGKREKPVEDDEHPLVKEGGSATGKVIPFKRES